VFDDNGKYNVLMEQHVMKRAFTLVELLIVVGILGIMAAIVIPLFQDYTLEAKEAAAKDNLRILRSVIEIYASKNGDLGPGYPGNNSAELATKEVLMVQVTRPNQTTGFENTISDFPKNPFNNKSTILIIQSSAAFPDAPRQTDTYGWIYKPTEKKIRLNWDGTDSDGFDYFDY